MTRLTVRRDQDPAQGDWEYRYSGTQNNGRIYQMKDWVSGEEVNYQYDSLNRLIAAATTGPEWGLSFGYDGFGNKWSQAVTKGSGPTLSVNIDAATNRIVGQSYDANGNQTTGGMVYDIENRLRQVPTSGGSYGGREDYGYAGDNRRVWKQVTIYGSEQDQVSEEVYFYGAEGMRLGTYRPVEAGGGLSFATLRTNVYFGGKLIREGGQAVILDRLGSVRGPQQDYYPYGEEKPSATAQNRQKFATYYRDATALDYADQRYYSSQFGRFMSPDPYLPSGGPANPQSWNRYTYVENDPVNYHDPQGLIISVPEPPPPPKRPSPPPDTGLWPVMGAGGGAAIGAGPAMVDVPDDIEDFGEDGVYQIGAHGPWLQHTFRSAQRLMADAAQTIAGQSKFRQPCEETLAALGLTGDALRTAAKNVVLADATTANVARAALYRNTVLYNSAVSEFGSQTIAQAATPTSGIAAFAELSGNTVYIDSRWISPFGTAYYDRVATMAHELIHNATGLTDSDIQRRLGLAEVRASKNISDRLRKDCW